MAKMFSFYFSQPFSNCSPPLLQSLFPGVACQVNNTCKIPENPELTLHFLSQETLTQTRRIALASLPGTWRRTRLFGLAGTVAPGNDNAITEALRASRVRSERGNDGMGQNRKPDISDKPDDSCRVRALERSTATPSG
ncbi:MAG TPA: hypothetical protein PLR76_05360 [Hyphomonas sp.]|nr:hypothetical protein [Hyphomonas sp.]